MAFGTGLYNRCPAFVQDLFVTAKGYQLRRRRYTPYTWERLAFLEKSQFWTREQFESYQMEQLRRLVEHAAQNSPFYCDLYRQRGVDPRALHCLEDRRLLPIVSKDEFRRNIERVFCPMYSPKDMTVSYTSGTTGTPLRAYHTRPNAQERVAVMERLYQWYTPGRFRRRASFTGKLIVPVDVNRGPFHRTNHAVRQQLYSSHHLTPTRLDRYLDELARFQPQQIDGIASPIYVVADHLLRTNRMGQVKPNVVIPTSETIWSFLRERMESGFGCPVANQYGSQEGAPVAYECPQGGFHTCPEIGLFEILGADGEPCPPGEPGRLVVTSFTSYATPLIRYEIGDIATWRAGDCPCGRKMPMFASMEGRVDDMFYTRERGVVPRVDSAFKSMPSAIIATQVAQTAIDRFEVRLIPDPALYQPGHGASLVEHLHDYLGASVHIDLKLVDGIARTAGGKLRAMVNECSDPEVRQAVVANWNRAQS